jgi:hypothetical protein
MAIHLEIETSSDYSIKNIVKINGNIVNNAYFTRNIIKIQPSPQSGFLIVVLPGDTQYLLTNNQDSESADILIVDSVNGVVPSSLLDLASKLNALIKW